MTEQDKIRWHPDAAAYDLNPSQLQRMLLRTSRVSNFLDTKKSVVIAPKGTGKTLLLRYISSNESERRGKRGGAIRIPSNRELDSVTTDIGMLATTKKALYEYKSWEDLWLTALTASVLSSFAIETQDGREMYVRYIQELKDEKCKLTEFLRRLLQLESYFTDDGEITPIPLDVKSRFNPSAFLNTLLQSTPTELHKSLKITTSISVDKALAVNRPVDVFIDQLDQGIFDYPLELWRHIQTSLVGAIFRLNHQPHLKIYTTIRLEAWIGFSHEHLTQIKGIVSELDYSDAELKAMFAHTIRVVENISNNDELSDDSVIASFLGRSSITKTSTGEEEEIFQYILRHTLRRPRDLALLGAVFHLQRTAPEGLTDENVRNIVNKVPADEVGDQYRKECVRFSPSLDAINFEKLYARFKTNVLQKRDLVELCSSYNAGVECIAKAGGSCRQCVVAEHVFCDLYRVGLVGVVTRASPSKENPIQKFRRAGDVTSAHLPDSPYYLIHPSMDHILTNLYDVDAYMPAPGITVGHNLPWLPRYSNILSLSIIEELLKTHVLDQRIRQDISDLVVEITAGNAISNEGRDRARDRVQDILKRGLKGHELAGEFARGMNNIVELLRQAIDAIPGIGD